VVTNTTSKIQGKLQDPLAGGTAAEYTAATATLVALLAHAAAARADEARAARMGKEALNAS
jgi:hypothetical protein